jgi:hypothetical protein
VYLIAAGTYAVSGKVHRQVGKSLDQRELRESRLRLKKILERDWRQNKNSVRR